MRFSSLLLLGVSTASFIAAASAAKTWAISAGAGRWLALTLILYTLGNLVMLHLIRDMGMAVALSLSTVIQLIAINAVALIVFGERISPIQGVGLTLAVASVTLVMLFPPR